MRKRVNREEKSEVPLPAGREKPPVKKGARSANTKKGGSQGAGGSGEKEKSLSEEALSAMDYRASAIVGCLLSHTIKGDVKSAQMLVNLAARGSEAQEALRHGPHRSQALAWAAEPPWEEDLDPMAEASDDGEREAKRLLAAGGEAGSEAHGSVD